MSTFVLEPGSAWQTVDVFGASMEKHAVFEGGYDVRSAYFKMPAGCTIKPHLHTKWVQVVVLSGEMLVPQTGEPDRQVGPGQCYFVDAGETHGERAVRDTMVLVTQGDDRPAR
jgi:quercetin dioxygenase-like cupin family protein